MSDSTDTFLGQLLPSIVNLGAGVVGSNNMAGQIAGGNQNAINTQLGIQQQLGGIYGPQRTAGNASLGTLAGPDIFAGQRAFGNNAMTTLGSLFGTNGQAPNYSAFMNQPGYQFGVDQGTKAIDRQAAATGSLYTPQTLSQVGGYVQGLASQQYNNYVGQLMQAAGLGAQGNSGFLQQLTSSAGFGAQGNAGLATGIYGTGNNISQAQMNIGNANASGTAGTAGAIGSVLGNPSMAGLYGNMFSGISSLFGNGSGAGNPNTSGMGIGDMTNGVYNGGAFGGGAPLYNNMTGAYPQVDPGYGGYVDPGASGNYTDLTGLGGNPS